MAPVRERTGVLNGGEVERALSMYVVNRFIGQAHSVSH